MATIYIDGQPYEAKEGNNLLHTCLSLGFNIPYFCWHPAMGSVGACRQCAVKQFSDENDKEGRIVMSCLTPVEDGLRISIDDPEVREFRASVIEWLMVNHPHDCPVCDEGGECHLQDMTVMTGHNRREFRFDKRTHRNQYLGPFINHEMNRCIACYRCVRFYREYSWGRDFDVFGSHDNVYFGRYEDGVLDSEFSGNLVEICPTGVFTDKTLKEHYTRKWDLRTAPSVCVHCGLGCNTIPGERYGELRRIRNRYHEEVNRYFLCDRGRYGYEFVNSERRVHRPMLRRAVDEAAEPLSKQDALAYIEPLLRDRERVIGIGSPRASLEANLALRTLVGRERFYWGLSENESRLIPLSLAIMRTGSARLPSLHDVELSDAVLVLGEDLNNTAPLLALGLRQSVRQIPIQKAEELLHIYGWQDAAVQEAIALEEGPLIVATPTGSKLDAVATSVFHGAPDDLARLGFAIAHILRSQSPDVEDLDEEVRAQAQEIAELLERGHRPLVVTGTNCGSEALIKAATNIAWALCREEGTAELCITVPECNSLGLAFIEGGTLDEAFQAVEENKADTVIVLENDLYRRTAPTAVDAFLEGARHVIAIEHVANATTAKAEIILPAATFAESTGTLVNNEARVQRFYQVMTAEGDVQASWRWLRDLIVAAGREEEAPWQIVDDVAQAVAEEIPELKSILDIAPPASFRMVGQKIPRESHRATGRTAIHANVDLQDPKPPDDPDSPLSFTMEGYGEQPPAPLIPRYWSPGWNSVQALNKFQSEVGGPLRGGDPGHRLIEPIACGLWYWTEIPPAFQVREGEWLVVPIHHIFGSEELSYLTPGIAQLSPDPYVALSPADAEAVRDGADTNPGADENPKAEEELNVIVDVDGESFRLPVRVVPAIPQGVAGLPLGLPHGPEVDLPAWGKIRRI